MDIETGERVEGELDAFIAKRDKQGRQTEGERRLEALWVESVKPYQERQEADHRAAWHEYEMRLYRIHSDLAAEHLEKAEK
jgi:hypothetical protein